MHALRARNNKPILDKSILEKVYRKLISIPYKTFSKKDLLMYVLRAYINRSHIL